jgi:hypothetical protein
MKRLIWMPIFLLVACGEPSDYRKPEDAMDAGREYINACLQGDFSKAALYALPEKKSEDVLKKLEKTYREKDKEGRQQLRTASINVSEIRDLTDSTTQIQYNNSFEKLPHTLFVVKRNGNWLVDLNKD